jgi:hypothetical protein
LAGQEHDDQGKIKKMLEWLEGLAVTFFNKGIQ